MRRLIPAILFGLTVIGCENQTTNPDRQDVKTDAVITYPAQFPVTDMQPFEGITPEMAGVWLSNGYGDLVVLAEDGLTSYKYTGEVCLPYNEDESSFTDYIDSYHLTEDGQTLHVGASAEQHTYQLMRQEALPELCEAPHPKTPTGNFDAFASFMKNHYVFFDLYGVDWAKEVADARPKVSDDMSDQALFDLMSHMMRGLKDAHLGLGAEIGGEAQKFDPDLGRTYSYAVKNGAEAGLSAPEAKRTMRRDFWFDGVRDGLLGGKGVMAGNDRLQYGVLHEDVGYFAMMTVGGYTEDGFDPYQDRDKLDGVLDDALTLFEDNQVKAVIVDGSFNHGGFDFISRQIASRFAAEPVKIYSKRPGDAAKPYKTQLILEPARGKTFTGPVYVLTSEITVSGGETMTMAMRPLPNVIHAGEATRGALSDVLEKHLPNGWVLTISSEVYLDHEGKLWEDRGIAPEMPLDVFPDGNMALGHAAAIQKIVDKIREN